MNNSILVTQEQANAISIKMICDGSTMSQASKDLFDLKTSEFEQASKRLIKRCIEQNKKAMNRYENKTRISSINSNIEKIRAIAENSTSARVDQKVNKTLESIDNSIAKRFATLSRFASTLEIAIDKKYCKGSFKNYIPIVRETRKKLYVSPVQIVELGLTRLFEDHCARDFWQFNTGMESNRSNEVKELGKLNNDQRKKLTKIRQELNSSKARNEVKKLVEQMRQSKAKKTVKRIKKAS